MSKVLASIKHLEPVPKDYPYAGIEYRDVHIIINTTVKQLLIDLGYSVHRAYTQQDIEELREPFLYLLPVLGRKLVIDQCELIAVPTTLIPRGDLCLHNIEDIKQYLTLCSIIPNTNNTLLPQPILEVIKSFKNLHYAMQSLGSTGY